MDPKVNSSSIEEEYEVINDTLPVRLSRSSTLADGTSSQKPEIEIHPLPNKDAMIISVHPPLKPAQDIPHVSCDIVLCIDVSGSMETSAPLPTAAKDGKQEHTGLSVLDLTKHAARTIIETLNGSDRLGVVVFSTGVETIFDLSYMTDDNKKTALQRIEAQRPQASTNLWHGLKESIKMLDESVEDKKQNVQAIYVLTDGQPNYMCPSQGYVPKLRQIAQKGRQLPLIHTFGFGYWIRSGLLQSIAEAGSGTYSFIPDAGMIGTVFVHAVANLFSTFATRATITIDTEKSLKLEQDEGSKMGIQLATLPISPGRLTLNIGNLQYGQSRDILIHVLGKPTNGSRAQATLIYTSQGSVQSLMSNEQYLSNTTYLPLHVCNYHRFRARICAFLRSLYPMKPDEEYKPTESGSLAKPLSDLQMLVKDLKSSGYKDEANDSLLQDLAGEEPSGQIHLALSQKSYYEKWGQHYLLSLLNAHLHQVCNSFKDPGPLQYGKDSPFFVKCRDKLDECFDNLPPPKPSLTLPPTSEYYNGKKKLRMSTYNSRSNPCFAGHCLIKLPEGKESIEIRSLRPKMLVWTPRGPRRVEAVVSAAVRDTALCNIGSLWITPWHPVQLESGSWLFPWQTAERSNRFSGTVYSVLLEPSSDPEAHALMVGGQVCVSLGHGIERGTDVRAHPFFGNYAHTARSLSKLPHDQNGVLLCGGMRRHPVTGLACGFAKREEHTRPRFHSKYGKRQRSAIITRKVALRSTGILYAAVTTW